MVEAPPITCNGWMIKSADTTTRANAFFSTTLYLLLYGQIETETLIRRRFPIKLKVIRGTSV